MFLAGVTFIEVLQWIGYILVAILCLMVMIMIHETGHYVAGKLFHFTILEYSIGFGPKIFQKVNEEKNEKFTIRLIPLGGYCQFAGEDEEAGVEGTFNSKPPWQRIIVLFAGAFMNLLSAVIFISIFFMAFGEFIPKVYKSYDYVDSAYVQQLQEGDVIKEVDGKKTYSLSNQQRLRDLIQGKDSVTLLIERDGEDQEIVVYLREYQGTTIDADGNEVDIHGTGLGITITYQEEKLPFFESIGHAFVFIWEEIVLIFTTIGGVFTGSIKASEALGGTVTSISVLSELAKNGFRAVMFGVCVLSASIGVMNLLPFPALDGCRIVFCIVEWIRGKPINRKIEAIINFAGLIILLLLAVLLDLLHFLG